MGKCTACYIVISKLVASMLYRYVCAVSRSASSQNTIPFSICVSWYTGAVKRRNG